MEALAQDKSQSGNSTGNLAQTLVAVSLWRLSPIATAVD